MAKLQHFISYHYKTTLFCAVAIMLFWIG